MRGGCETNRGGTRVGVATASETDAVARLRAATAFVFDMDGVLYRGSLPLPGVAELLDALALRGRGVMLATNNSTATAASYVAKLAKMGIVVAEDAILTSALATRDYLRQTLPAGSGVFVVGSPALREQLFTDSDFYPVQYGEEQPAAVVVGMDTGFDYAKLSAAMVAIRGGARFIATNTDATLPIETGFVPGAGSIVAAVATASGRDPLVIGKPETPMLEMALARLRASPAQAVMIGDRLETDILAGARAGMTTVLVLTGASTRDEIASAPARPDLVANDLPALTSALIGG
ncbi:MAG: HAD-IIA family hydrolase [Thermomicrobiales bacterium]|nr:HAD-IIA family hydrolase [Thermomicrobiales bacterium]